MLQSLDPKTLAIIITLFGSINGVALCLYAKTQSSFRGFWLIGIGFLVLALSFGLISFRGHVSDWISIIFPGFLTVYSIKMIGTGILHFFNFPSEKYEKSCYLMLGIQLTVFIYFTVIVFEPNWRILVVCTIFSTQCFYLSFKLFQSNDTHHRLPILILYSLFIVYGIAFLSRVIWGVIYYQEASNELQTLAYISSLMTFLMMIVITSFILIWVANDRLQIDLKLQATIDPLTQIYNRRALESLVQKEIARAKRDKNPFSVIMVDLDLFKKLNDQYGHQFGDQVLEQFSGLIRSSLRKYDIFARFGGEEFIIIMPDTQPVDAITLANKLCKLVAEKEYVSQDQSIRKSVTASFGITDSGVDNISWSKLVAESDKALYQAKQQGRNKVVHFQDI
jgi:diguanylate cyclase (GGDEF)-like protein